MKDRKNDRKITVKEAIYELNFALGEIYDQVFYDYKPYEFDENGYKALDMAKEFFEQNQWIPCSERLPEYMVSVLTWDGYAFCIEKRIPYIRDDDGFPIEGDYWVGDEYDDLESDYYPNLRDGACIAWMPLPAPYTESEVDE